MRIESVSRGYDFGQIASVFRKTQSTGVSTHLFCHSYRGTFAWKFSVKIDPKWLRCAAMCMYSASTTDRIRGFRPAASESNGQFRKIEPDGWSVDATALWSYYVCI